MNYDDLVLSLEYVADHIAKDEMWPYEQSLRDAADAIQELQRDAGMFEAVLRDAGITIKRGPHGITWEWQSNSFGKAIDEAMQQEQGRGTG